MHNHPIHALKVYKKSKHMANI